MRRILGSSAGGALVELALVASLLVAIMAGAVDFARVFYTSMALTSAARAGAQYGAANHGNSGQFSTMETIATNSVLPDVACVAAVASRTCQCATDVGGFSAPASCATIYCGTGHNVVTVTVTASKTFTRLMGSLPGLPGSIAVSRSATLRVSN